MLKVGIDIGGTKIAGAVVDADGRIVEKLRVDTPVDTRALADAVVDMVASLRRSLTTSPRSASPRPGSSIATAPPSSTRPNIALAQRAAEGDPRGADRRAGHDRERRERGRLGGVPLRRRPRRRRHGHAHDGHRRRRRGRRRRRAVPRRPRHRRRARAHPLHPRRPARAAAGRTDASSSMRPDAPCSARRTRSRMPAASAPRWRRLRAEKGTISGPAVSRLVAGRRPGRGRSAAPRRRPRSARRAAASRRCSTPSCSSSAAVSRSSASDLLGPVRIAYETSLPGYGDRPDRGVRDRRARQRRRPHRRGRPRDRRARVREATSRREGSAMFYWLMKYIVIGPLLEGDLPAVDRRPPKRARRGRRDPRQQPPLVHRLGLPAAHDRPADRRSSPRATTSRARASRAGRPASS